MLPVVAKRNKLETPLRRGDRLPYQRQFALGKDPLSDERHALAIDFAWRRRICDGLQRQPAAGCENAIAPPEKLSIAIEFLRAVHAGMDEVLKRADRYD